MDFNKNKKELVQEIINSYINEFRDCKDETISTIYEDLGKSDLFTLEDYTTLKKLSLSEIIALARDSKSLRDFLEELYDGEYKYEWHEKSYICILNEYIDPSNALEFLGLPYISSYIDKNYSKRFVGMFKEELELEDDWNDDDIDICYYNDIIEDYLDSDNIDYIISPEYIIEEWLEEETIDVNRVLKAILNEENLKNNENLLHNILIPKLSHQLLIEINKLCRNVYIDYIPTIVFNYMQEKLKEFKDNPDVFNKIVDRYKNIPTLEDLLKDGAFKRDMIKSTERASYLENIMKEAIFNAFEEEYLFEHITKLDDDYIKQMLINYFGEEYIVNALGISKDELISYIEKAIFTFIRNTALTDRLILNLNPYELYIRGASILNEKPLFHIDTFKFEDDFLENNIFNVYKAAYTLYSKEGTLSLVRDINILLSESENLLAEKIYDMPNRINISVRNIKRALKELAIKSKDNNDNINTIDRLTRLLSKLEAYKLFKEIGIESYRINYSEILNYPKCLNDIIRHSFHHMLDTVYTTENIKTKLKETLAENPKDEFTLARSIHRHFIVNVGETNTGKTYNAIQRLKESENGGVYLAPLRLLALEIQEKLNLEGVPCNLSTGEEEDLIEGAVHESLTIEKANFDKRYDICVIDECQMVGDEQRGYAWTNAILGIYSKEIHLCVAPEALSIVLSLIDSCGDTYEIIEHHRNTPLILEDVSYNFPNKKGMQSLKKGDALVVFSKRDALGVSSQLKTRGISSSVIYGALPYQSRKKQFELFLNEETDVLVSTDAIGMGVNLPIRRVVFLETEKYDGKRFRSLNHSEVKQISGRAGRQGIYEEGFVNSIKNKGLIKRLLENKTPDVKQAILLPPKSIIHVDNSLLKTIRAWNEMTFSDLYKKGDTSRLMDMLNRLSSYEDKLSKEDMYRAITLPFDEKNQTLYELFKTYLKCYINDKDSQLSKPRLNNAPTLDELETYYKKLDLYYAFGTKFGMEIDLIWLNKEKNFTSISINELIINNIMNLKKKCPQCGKQLDFAWQHKLCNSCFRKNNTYYSYCDYY